ncbi:MAG: hypothetical protein STSR0008_09680 [Ignavibacterium sp.]
MFRIETVTQNEYNCPKCAYYFTLLRYINLHIKLKNQTLLKEIQNIYQTFGVNLPTKTSNVNADKLNSDLNIYLLFK